MTVVRGQGYPGMELTVDDPYTTPVKKLPDKVRHYALYDATYETKEKKKEGLLFIFWAP